MFVPSFFEVSGNLSLAFRTILFIFFMGARFAITYFKPSLLEVFDESTILYLPKVLNILSSLSVASIFKKLWSVFISPRSQEGRKKIFIFLLNLFVELSIILFLIITLLSNLGFGFTSLANDLEAIIITSTLVCFLWYFTANNYFKTLKEWLNSTIDDRKESAHTINSFSFDLQLFLFFIFLKFTLRMLNRVSLLDIFTEILSENHKVLRIVDSLTLLFGFMFMKRLLDVIVIFMKKAMNDSENFSSSGYLFVIPILSNLGTIALLIFFIIYLFKMNGYKLFDFAASLPDIIKSLGILGIGLSFMAKDTVENLISGLFILTDSPFAIGDRINVNGIEGDVHDIGIRTTKLRTIYNTIITLPNSYITKNAVTSYRKFSNKIRIIYEIGVRYGTDPDKVKGAIESVVENCNEVLKVPIPATYFASYESFFLKFKIVFWVRDVSKRLEAFDSINKGIAIKFKELDIGIPYPIYDVNMKIDSGKEHLLKESEIPFHTSPVEEIAIKPTQKRGSKSSINKIEVKEKVGVEENQDSIEKKITKIPKESKVSKLKEKVTKK